MICVRHHDEMSIRGHRAPQSLMFWAMDGKNKTLIILLPIHKDGAASAVGIIARTQPSSAVGDGVIVVDVVVVVVVRWFPLV